VSETPSKGRFTGSFNPIGAIFVGGTSSSSDGRFRARVRHRIWGIEMER
jgi:hypothetical protein